LGKLVRTTAVKRRLGRDGIGLAAERKGRLADVEFEVLGHLVAVDDGADLEANLVFAAQRLPGARDGGGDDGEIAFGRGQQVEYRHDTQVAGLLRTGRHWPAHGC
jgi:hypothetical protein